MARPSPKNNSYGSNRAGTSALTKSLYLGICKLSAVSAAPLMQLVGIESQKNLEGADDPSLWLYLSIAVLLVLLGGVFAGLTIALMGLDDLYLAVIAESGEGKEQRHAQKVHGLLRKGKHWVLVTLLLSNVIVNESLPIVLDRSLGGGWPAVLGSTALIVIFGEVIPQSVCVRYGLSIGAYMAPCVWILMLLLAPIAWPIAKLLDKLLGEDHGTVYKKSGLKTLVTLHKTLGSSPTDRLNQDEVTIISAVLDLKDKPVGVIMTPMADVFTMAADTILDEDTMNIILSAGYSRIPIYEPGNPQNFVGMLLVKILITYDPEDCKKVNEFALATLPETRFETSCLDIVNFFQEGKSHMVLVSEYPGENYGAIGVVTLEDVIEELIGEEIIDESDVFIDVHKAIRRLAPYPKARVQKGHIVGNADTGVHNCTDDHLIDLRDENEPLRKRNLESHSAPGKTTFLRRSSAGANDGETIQIRNAEDMREHFKHLGPSNLASRPKTTRYQTVKIKPGLTTISSENPLTAGQIIHEPYRDLPAPGGGEGEGLLKSGGREASDGVHALQQGYGSLDLSTSASKAYKFEQSLDGGAQDYSKSSESRSSNHRFSSALQGSGILDSHHSDRSSDTLGSIHSYNQKPRKRGTARSGSITENVIEAGGIRKVVLETTSNSDDEANNEPSRANGKKSSNETVNDPSNGDNNNSDSQDGPPTGEAKKKRRRTRKKKGGKVGEGSIASGEGEAS